MNYKILIVEDEAILALAVRKQLENLNYSNLIVSNSVESALQEFHNNTPDIILMDIKIYGDKDGIELAHMIREKSEIPIIFLTGNSDNRTVKRAKDISNSLFLVKPITESELKDALDELLTKEK
ncbi:MAG: response regulator [Leptospiraceae bacterium]|nr:response regulator [Leptospiraceae bacterium]MCP5498733.1 response regulator [Leptospiraceae bacterium]